MEGWGSKGAAAYLARWAKFTTTLLVPYPSEGIFQQSIHLFYFLHFRARFACFYHSNPLTSIPGLSYWIVLLHQWWLTFCVLVAHLFSVFCLFFFFVLFPFKISFGFMYLTNFLLSIDEVLTVHLQRFSFQQVQPSKCNATYLNFFSQSGFINN